MDYTIQKGMKNCCIINLPDMLGNGTVINGKMVESPKSFQTACTITTQIIAQVASGQYGGQSIELSALAPYARVSYEKHLKHAYEEQTTIYGMDLDTSLAKQVASKRTQREVEAGIQTIQYQINTLNTSNGQAPFVTVLLYIEDGHEYENEQAMLCKELLKQRMQGLKNDKGEYVTPTFPKLIYVLDENNITPTSKYWDITQLSVKCSAKRLYPDYLSAKMMRKNYEGNVFPPMGCRSLLIPWKDEEDNYKFAGRFNQGVVTLNIPQIAILSNGDHNIFWKLLDERLELSKEALMVRHNLLKGTKSDVSPIHWQHGAIARLEEGETIDHLLYGNYSTLSLGYIGMYEASTLMTGGSHTKEEGEKFTKAVMKTMYDKVLQWREETNIGFSLYGTPAESLCYRFAKIDKEKFGDIENVTDKGYYMNSYHVNVKEEINAFDKLKFESQFQDMSLGGCISYIEIPNMFNNYEAMEDIVQFMYNNIQYAEFNTKSDVCHECGFDREILLNDNMEWYCPECGNKNTNKMTITRRTCG